MLHKDFFHPTIRKRIANNQVLQTQITNILNIFVIRISQTSTTIQCRIYVSGENLLTWTPFVTDYIDPEQPVADSNGRSYPMSKTFSVGLDITF